KQIEELLIENKIPHYFKSGNIGVKFETVFMKLFDNYFRIKIYPSDRIHSRKLLNLLKVENFEDENQINESTYNYFSFIKNIVSDLTVDNFKKSLKSIENFIKEDSAFSDEDKIQISNELEGFNDLWTEYSYNNLKPTLTGFKNAISLGTVIKHQKEE